MYLRTFGYTAFRIQNKDDFLLREIDFCAAICLMSSSNTCLSITTSGLGNSVWQGWANFQYKGHVHRAYVLSLGQTLSTFHYTLLDKCRALLSVVKRGWPNALNFSLDLELNIPQMYYLMNNSFMECFVHYVMNSNCTCARSTTLDNFALDQTLLDKKQSSRLHSTRWPNALDISLNMDVELIWLVSRNLCMVKCV